jgi:hypothetical protein
MGVVSVSMSCLCAVKRSRVTTSISLASISQSSRQYLECHAALSTVPYQYRRLAAEQQQSDH